MDANLYYESDALVASSNATATKMFYDVAIGMDLSKKGDWTLAWSLNSFSISDTGSSINSYTVSDMGPKFGYFINKDKTFSLSITYHLLAKAKYTSDSTEVEWRGTSYVIDFGYTPQITEQFFMGIKLNYFNASYSEEFSGTTTVSQVSYSRTLIYPSLCMSYRY